MKKRQLFSGLMGLIIGSVLFWSALQAHAAINTISITTPTLGAVRLGTQTISWTNDSTGFVDIQYCKEPACSSASYTTISWNVLWSGGGSYSRNTTTAAGDSNQYKIRIRAAGNDTIATISNYFTIDNTTPTWWSFSINAGAAYTNSTSVNLTTTCATDAGVGWVQVAFGNTASPTNRQSCSSNMSWTLTAGDATKTVYMRFRDSAWNTTSDTTDTIIFDGTPPVVMAWADIVTNHAVFLTGTVDGNISWIGSLLWTNNSTEIWTFTIPGAVDNQSTLHITDASANGTYIVQFASTDNAGNTNSDTMNLTWDTVAPTVASIVTSPNPASGTVNVTVYFTEALAWIYTSFPPTVSLVVNGTPHVVTPNNSGTHVNGYSGDNHLAWEWTVSVAGLTNGTATFTVTGAKDLALNTMTNTSTWSMTIDTAWPTFVINDGVQAWPVQSDTINVSVSDATTSVTSTSYGFSSDIICNGSDTYDHSFTSAVDFAIAWNYHSPTTRLCLRAIDAAGNISYTNVGIINTDNTPTAAPTISTPIITPVADTTPPIWITVAEANGQSINIYSGWVLFQTVSTPISGANTITLNDVGEGIHSNFTATFTDQAGNESAAVNISSFTVDVTKPVVTITPLNPAYTNDSTPTFTGTVTDNLSAITGVEYSLDDGGTWTDVGVTADDESFDSSNENYSITPASLEDWAYTIIVRATDQAGNVTTSYATHTFYIDTKNPSVTFNIPTDANTTLSIAGNAINNWLSSISNVEYFIDTVGVNGAGWALTLAAPGTGTKNFNGTINVSWLTNGTHLLYVHAKNVAGTRWPTVYHSFNTQSLTGAADGIVVNSVARILNGTTPTAGGTYTNGYHFRFNLTINDSSKDTLNFKLSDWSNSLATMAVANNTKVVVSANGVATDTDGTTGTTAILTGADRYSSNLNINGMDRDTSTRGKQLMADMFYKIPTWAQGIFSTMYGIQVVDTER